jgi:hypothetical protein
VPLVLIAAAIAAFALLDGPGLGDRRGPPVEDITATLETPARVSAARDDRVVPAWVAASLPEGEEGEVAYPAAVRASDGAWHVAYSAHAKTRIRHARFDPVWLSRCLD